MSNWYCANKWGGEVIMLTPEEAARAIPAKLKGESIFLSRIGVIDTKQFESIEESSRVYTGSNTSMFLGTGEVPGVAQTGRRRPLMSSDGMIYVRWVKRFMREREYNKNYAAQPFYFALRQVEERNGLFVAFSWTVYQDELDNGLPEGLELLEDWETIMLEKRLVNRPGWWNR